MLQEVRLFSGDQVRYFLKRRRGCLLLYLLMKGFVSTKEAFRETFSAATGMAVDRYKGDTPSKEVWKYIYHSTAVAGDYKIPLHQEVSGGNRRDMLKYLFFFCEVPPLSGSGCFYVSNQIHVDLSNVSNSQLSSFFCKARGCHLQ